MDIDNLRVLIANDRPEWLELLAKTVAGLGHQVVMSSTSVSDVAAETAETRPDVALVGLGESSDHALELVSEIVSEAYCPVIAVLANADARWVKEAAKRGLFGYVLEGTPEELQTAMDITLRRFGDVQSLKGAVARRTAEAQRESEMAGARQRQALELHDRVLQRLVAAQMAHDLGREEMSREALSKALENAKALVSRSLDGLRDAGLSNAEIIRAAAAHPADE